MYISPPFCATLPFIRPLPFDASEGRRKKACGSTPSSPARAQREDILHPRSDGEEEKTLNSNAEDQDAGLSKARTKD